MTRIEIYDTTLRDGSQAEGISFSLMDKLAITQRLDSIGVDYVEGGYPASNKKDAQYFQRVRELPLKHVRVCAFGMTRRKGVKACDDEGLRALLDSAAKTITIVGKSSLFQVGSILRATPDENLAMIGESVGFLVANGREVIFDAEHFFDGWKGDCSMMAAAVNAAAKTSGREVAFDVEQIVDDWKANAFYSLRALRAAADAGARMVVLCDTNGGTMPEAIAQAVRCAVKAVPVPVGIHCHNDCELAVANSLAAVDAGAVQVQGTINGFGERCGNVDLISVAANLALKKQGYEVLLPGGVQHLTELSRFVYETINMNFRPHQPFVGKSAFAHKGGMHVSGIARNTAAYEHIEPETVGNERRVLVSELSGRSNLLAMTERHKIPNDSALMDSILAQVVSLENAGYQFEAADGSFDLLVRRCMGSFRPHFQRLSYHVNVETNAAGEIRTEATVKIRVGDEVLHEVAEGDGPVNALDAAMRKALNGHFPGLKKLHLVDYKVRVINSEAATAAGVRVVIESQDETDVWGTVGVSENVIEASWIALVDSFEYKLWKDDAGPPLPPGQGRGEGT